MNERIKELIEQATESTGFLTAGDSVKPLPVREFNKEKFAELIVRECIEICNQHSSKIFKKEWDDDVVAWDITQRIKGRFGVE